MSYSSSDRLKQLKRIESSRRSHLKNRGRDPISFFHSDEVLYFRDNQTPSLKSLINDQDHSKKFPGLVKPDISCNRSGEKNSISKSVDVLIYNKISKEAPSHEIDELDITSSVIAVKATDIPTASQFFAKKNASNGIDIKMINPIDPPPDEIKEIFSFGLVHCPLPLQTNFSHSEIVTYKNGARMTKDIPKTLSKELARILKNKFFVELDSCECIFAKLPHLYKDDSSIFGIFIWIQLHSFSTIEYPRYLRFSQKGNYPSAYLFH